MCVRLQKCILIQEKLLNTEAYEEIKKKIENYHPEKSTLAMLGYFLLVFKIFYVYTCFS